MSENALARRYLLYKGLSNLWFISAVWLYFYRLFITDQQVGYLDAVAFAIGLLAEIPSAALADSIGRSRLVRVGQILTGVGLLLQAAGSSFVPFVVGQSIMMIGVAFVSGADDALFFDNLEYKHNTLAWRKLVTRGSQVALVATLVATMAGGALQHISPRLPWILTGIAFIAAAISIWPIHDLRHIEHEKSHSKEVRTYLQHIQIGLKQFTSNKLVMYVPIIILVQGLFYTTGYGILRIILLDRFHFSPFWGSVSVASCSLITIGLLAYMHRRAEYISEKTVLLIIGFSAAAGLLLSVANIGALGYLVILTLYAGEYLLDPFMSEVLNKHAPDNQRATVLSVASFLKTLPYVFLAPIIGTLNTHGHLEYFLVIWASLICFALVYYARSKAHDTKMAVPIE